MSGFWTQDECDQLERLLREGHSASEIGRAIGRERNAVISKVHRTPALKNVGFAGSTHGRRNAQKRMRNTTAQRNRATIKLVSPPIQAKQPPAPKFSHAPTQSLIADWLKENGGPRRFDRGDSADLPVIRREMEEAGYKVAFHRSHWFLGRGKGRPKKVTIRELVAAADELRIARGAEPILARA